jgi:hypothetical protein
MESSAAQSGSGGRLLLAGTLGALIALSLGIYGNVHEPASDLSITLGFQDTITMKVWLASAAILCALFQLFSALWMYGKLPLREGPAWLGAAHRISGRLAFLLSLPVAYHCLYQLAFQDTTTRVLAHSLLAACSTAHSRSRSWSSARTRCRGSRCRWPAARCSRSSWPPG